jgi:hypothetical protein
MNDTHACLKINDASTSAETLALAAGVRFVPVSGWESLSSIDVPSV